RLIALERRSDIDEALASGGVGVAEIILQLDARSRARDHAGAGSVSNRDIVTTIPGSGANDYGVASACASRAVAPCCCARIGSKYTDHRTCDGSGRRCG